MKINIKKDYIKENLKANDKMGRRADLLFYLGVLFFYPVFIGLSVVGGSLATGSIVKPFIYSTLFYIILAVAGGYIRYKIIAGSYHLFVPEKIEGTKREDFSLISSKILMGQYQEADADATMLFASEPSIDLILVVGDTFCKYKQYKLGQSWFQRGVNIAKGGQRLYLLDRIRELTELHLYDKTRIVMYLEMIAKDFPNSLAGAEAQKRVDFFRKTNILK